MSCSWIMLWHRFKSLALHLRVSLSAHWSQWLHAAAKISNIVSCVQLCDLSRVKKNTWLKQILFHKKIWKVDVSLLLLLLLMSYSSFVTGQFTPNILNILWKWRGGLGGGLGWCRRDKRVLELRGKKSKPTKNIVNCRLARWTRQISERSGCLGGKIARQSRN